MPILRVEGATYFEYWNWECEEKFFSLKFSENFQSFSKFIRNFLAIFRNEITTILTPSASEGGGHVFHFEGPWLRIRNVNILIYTVMDKSKWTAEKK